MYYRIETHVSTGIIRMKPNDHSICTVYSKRHTIEHTSKFLGRKTASANLSKQTALFYARFCTRAASNVKGYTLS